jgi:hypothetical protein
MTHTSVAMQEGINTQRKRKKDPKSNFREYEWILRIINKKLNDMLKDVLSEYHSLRATTL